MWYNKEVTGLSFYEDWVGGIFEDSNGDVFPKETITTSTKQYTVYCGVTKKDFACENSEKLDVGCPSISRTGTNLNFRFQFRKDFVSNIFFIPVIIR